jgi:F-type H+-transporting ATPase subunit a
MGKPEVLAWLAFDLGPLHLGTTVLTTWLLMAVLTGVAWLGTRRMSLESPSRLQIALEGSVLALQQGEPGRGWRTRRAADSPDCHAGEPEGSL